MIGGGGGGGGISAPAVPGIECDGVPLDAAPVAAIVIGGGGGGGGGICPVEGASGPVEGVPETGGLAVVDRSCTCEGDDDTGGPEIDPVLDVSIDPCSVDSKPPRFLSAAEEVVLWGKGLPSLGFRSCCSS
jgi:hypothetical protein